MSRDGSSASDYNHVHDEYCTTWRTDLRICRGLCIIKDVKVCTKTGSYKVHSSFLKARSPVMASMLKQNPDEINAREFDHDAINTLLEYIYSGEVKSLKITTACDVYKAAHLFELPLLKKQCIRFMKSNVSVPSMPDIARLALKHGEANLLRKMKEFCAKNLLDVVKSSQWVDFLGKNPQLANEILQEALEITRVTD